VRLNLRLRLYNPGLIKKQLTKKNKNKMLNHVIGL
jgi:hypothetical protein